MPSSGRISLVVSCNRQRKFDPDQTIRLSIRAFSGHQSGKGGSLSGATYGVPAQGHLDNAAERCKKTNAWYGAGDCRTRLPFMPVRAADRSRGEGEAACERAFGTR